MPLNNLWFNNREQHVKEVSGNMFHPGFSLCFHPYFLTLVFQKKKQSFSKVRTFHPSPSHIIFSMTCCLTHIKPSFLNLMALIWGWGRGEVEEQMKVLPVKYKLSSGKEGHKGLKGEKNNTRNTAILGTQ